MTKNDFRVTSIFKVVIKICKKNAEFCGKTSKFLPKRCLFIFCIFYLNEEELNQQVCLIKYVEKYVENEISNTFYKTKREREKQKHNSTSKTSFLKLLKNCIQSFINNLLYTIVFPIFYTNLGMYG